ncbi:hypothetical protein B4N84_22535 [Flavobacterium sp. IR1]|nr:hypothetical protein B4N84_22535 [Flavobacterium sp. IR1]
MAKLKIYGNANPVVGKKEFYSVDEFFAPSPSLQLPETDFKSTSQEEVKWSIWVKYGNEWTKMTSNNKTGTTVCYTFSQVSITRKGIRMLVEKNGEKALLEIQTHKTTNPSIVKVDLLDANYNIPTKAFAYGETIIARVHCVDMEMLQAKVTLWEDNGDKNNAISSNLIIESKQGNILNGICEISFYLNPMNAWRVNANNANEGEMHEYYVTAEIFTKKYNTATTKNTNVANPQYIPSPAEQKGPSNKDQQQIAMSDRRVHDYNEQRVKISPTIAFPVREVTNSLMMVDMDPQTWWPFKETHGKCKNCEKDITLNDIENAFGTYINHKIARQEIVKYINEFVKLSKEKGKPIHLDTCLRKAHFFAQIGTETLGINPDWMVETDAKRYSVVNCKTVFGDRAKHLENAGLLDDYCSDNPQKRLLNYVYGKGNGFDNGNGNEASGDGYKFRGRGLKQLTGRGNYKDASKILKDVFPEHYIDLEANPDKVKEPKYAVLTAFAFWEKHEIWKVADSLKESTDDNIKKIRSKINPGLAGWRECKKYFEKGLEVFKVNKCQPVDGTQEDNGKWRFPIDNPMLCMYSQGGLLKPWHGSFGKNIRDELANHTGNDLLAEPGTKVYACVRSKVEKIYTSSSLAGKVVVLKVLDVETFKSLRNENYLPKYKNKGEILEKGFDPDGDLYLTFWHLSKNNFFNVGDEVEYDDIIGLTGISGWNGINFSTRNPHLHFEVSNVGSAPGLEGKCNPSVYFKFKTEDELSQNEINFQNRLKEKEWK